jgi:nitrate reductase gamma subunit
MGRMFWLGFDEKGLWALAMPVGAHGPLLMIGNLVLWHRRIHFVRPRRYSAFQV